MNRPVLVLGAQGMLGTACSASLQASGIDHLGTQRSDDDAESYFDVTAPDAGNRLERLLQKYRPGYVVNAVAVLKASIGTSEDSIRLAHAVNSEFPHLLATTAARFGALVIHVSTDGVFASALPRIFTEEAPPNAEDVYGRSKRLGEPDAPNVLVVRTSIIGRDFRHRRGLVEWFLSQPSGSEVTGFADRPWTGVTAGQLARFITEVIVGKRGFDEIRRRTGILHYVPNAPLSKFELLTKLNAISEKNVLVRKGVSAEGSAGVTLGTLYPTFQTIAGSTPTWDDLLKSMLGGSAREE